MKADLLIRISGLALAAAALYGLATGCASPPPPAVLKQSVFYPPPPAPARVQYLSSYTREQDLHPQPRNWLLRFLVGPPPPPPPLVKPYGVALHDGKLYVCDTVRRSIAVFDLERRQLTNWAPEGEGGFRTPINISFDAEGYMYVADVGRGQVMVYAPAGDYLGAFMLLSGMKPTDVAVLGEKAYVADVENHRVVVFHTGTFEDLFSIPRDTNDDEAVLFSPTNLALDADHRLYVTDTGASRIQVYDAEGHFLRRFGSPGDAPGQFARPKGLAVDRTGRAYVVDAAMQAVQVFDAEGRLLMFFGEPGASDVPLSLPADVAIDYDHVDRFRAYADPGFDVEYLVLVTSQYGARKVNVYGFGKEL